MKNNRGKVLKVLVGVIVTALIGGILFFVNAFAGNPISEMIANKAIEKYVDENYPSLDLEIEKANYNFKTGAYMARAKSKTSIDTKFPIYYRKGEIRDDYESYVLGKFNTWQRLSDEYSVIAKDIIAKELGYEDNTTIVIYKKDELTNDVLELDMEFDRSLPLDSEVLIRVDLRDRTLEGIAKILTDAYKAFVDNDCNFSEYSLSSEVDSTYVSVHGVTPNDIESGELISILEEAKNNSDVEGISVTIKEKNN